MVRGIRGDPGEDPGVRELIEGGAVRFDRGDLPNAIDAYQQAVTLLREATAHEPDRWKATRQLARISDTLGAWHLANEDIDAAVIALNEAESAYERLTGDSGFGRPGSVLSPTMAELQREFADMLMRRAEVHALGVHPASALVDTQRAVLMHNQLRPYEDGPAMTPELARALGRAAFVLMRHGDPDLAVAAADIAVRAYLNLFGDGTTVTVPPDHSPSLLLAAQTAAIIHEAHGRADLVGWLERFLTGLIGDEQSAMRDPDLVEALRVRPTFAQVLGRADPSLVGILTAPATECRITLPMTRCPADRAAGYAARLVELALPLLDTDTPAGIRLGLEAHALFAGASQARTTSMRQGFATSGPAWALLLFTMAAVAARKGDLRSARDFSDWLTGTVGKLAPYALVDQETRVLAWRCVQWQTAFYREVGDPLAAERCAEAAAQFTQRTE